MPEVNKRYLNTLNKIILDWSNSIYEVTNREQSLGVCYYKVKNNEGDKLSRSFYRQELNLVARK